MIASVKAVAITKQIVLRDQAKRPMFDPDTSAQEAKYLRFTEDKLGQTVEWLGFNLDRTGQEPDTCILCRVDQVKGIGDD